MARGIPARKLGAYILDKKILCTDEVSGDGRKWIRADQLRHLAPYFSIKNSIKEKQEPASIFPQAESNSSEYSIAETQEVPHNPPGLETELVRLVRMLEDINK